MEIAVDDGSMPTTCPPCFGGVLAIEERQKVHFVDIQRQQSKSYRKQNILLSVEVWRDAQ